MATSQDYQVGAAALLKLEQQIIAQKNIPTFMLPSQDVMSQYALEAAKTCIDAVDAARAAAQQGA